MRQPVETRNATIARSRTSASVRSAIPGAVTRSISPRCSGLGRRFGSFGRSIATPRSPGVQSSRAQKRRNDRSATSRRCRVWGESGLATAAAAGHRHLKFPQQIPIHAGELVDAGGAGEGQEAGQVDAVGADGVRAAATVKGLQSRYSSMA
jgi:hypothetical protein